MLSLIKESHEWIPLFHIPIPKKHNPMVLISTQRRVSISLETLKESEDLRIEGLEAYSKVKELISSFINKLFEEVSMKVGLEILVNTPEGVHEGFLYAFITNAVVELLSGEFNEDLIKAATVIDSLLNLEDFVYGLRRTYLASEPFIWRVGDDPISINRKLTAYVDVVFKQQMGSSTEMQLTDLITHLSGLTTIHIFRALRDGSELRDLIRVYNGIWYILYEVIPPKIAENERYFIVYPDIGNVVIAEVRFH